MHPPSRSDPAPLDLARYESSLPVGTPVQGSFDDLGVPLREATFVVVDLETTGTSPTTDHITEIGAVKVRGGEVLGEFATLVNPGVPIPPRITVLTGITTAMVVDAPTLGEVLPAFVEFSHGSFLVAHNARFDMGFLKAATKSQGLAWSPAGQVDTLALARRVVTRDEAPNHKLSSLARIFGSPTKPDHRALTDARATVDVLHGLFERLGSLGVTHVDDLNTAADPVPPARRRRVHLADGLPPSPGVYMFLGPGGEVLYVGTAKNLRRRVRQYFTSAPDRRRIGEMVDLAIKVEVLTCPTEVEAGVRELRLIAEHDPPYNRRSKRPNRLSWVRLTDEPLPRASIVRSVPPGVGAIGPFTRRSQAQEAVEAIEGRGIRACHQRLPLVVSPEAKACALLDMGRCSAPCVDQAAVHPYGGLVTEVRSLMSGDVAPAYEALMVQIKRLAAGERYEEAARARDRLIALLRGVHTATRLGPWWGSANTVATRWSTYIYPEGAWEMVVIRYGRLAASGVCPPRQDPLDFADGLTASAAFVEAPTRRGGAASIEETTLLATWVEAAGVRLIEHQGEPLAWPRGGPKRFLNMLDSPTRPAT